MSRPLSRPRTHIYNANYNIGESYYKSALDGIDRKYGGRPLTPPPRNSSIPRDLLERHERAFADEDLPSARLRAEKHITEPSFFDRATSRASAVASRALEALENDIDEETVTALKRIRASKKVSMIDDVGLDNTVNSLTARRIKQRSEKLLDAVGINEESAAARNRATFNDDVSYKRRTLRTSAVEEASSNGESGELTKWSPIANREDSAAALRVKQSRIRLEELEDEANQINERQQARERRAARLRQIVSEFDNDDDEVAAISSVRASRKEKRMIDVE